MTITFSIRNVTSNLVNKIMLRKFFQMVFVGNDKKSLHIYTATIVGASNESITETKTNFISDLEQFKAFSMQFEFAVGSNDSNEIMSIHNENLTDSEHGFLKEIECIRKVWGNKSRIISGNQGQILDKLKTIYDKEDVDFTDDEKRVTANLTKHDLLWTEQKKSNVPPQMLHSLAIEGEFQDVEVNKEQNARDGVFVRRAYSIRVPQNIELPKGVELVNWVRTTIDFKYGFDDTNLNYIIKNDCNKDEQSGNQIIAPDFTWYFSPVVKSFIDNRNCMIEIKRGNLVGENECTCPLQNQKRKFYTNDKFQNSIDAVPNKLTVNFFHWDNDEKINSRQKYRLAAKDVLPNPNSFEDVSEISIFLDTADEHNRGNRQFILGVFISFALAFGIDSGRLKDIEFCFWKLKDILPADVWWIIFLTLFSLSLMNKPAKLSEESRKLMKRRKFVLISSIIWIAIVYGLFRVPLLKPFITLNARVFGMITGLLFIILCGAHLFYLRKCKVDVKDSLWVDLFGEDIL